jgi:hypothetical protein
MKGLRKNPEIFVKQIVKQFNQRYNMLIVRGQKPFADTGGFHGLRQIIEMIDIINDIRDVQAGR